MVAQTIILAVLASMVVGYALFLTLCVLGRFLWAILSVALLYAMGLQLLGHGIDGGDRALARLGAIVTTAVQASLKREAPR